MTLAKLFYKDIENIIVDYKSSIELYEIKKRLTEEIETLNRYVIVTDHHMYSDLAYSSVLNLFGQRPKLLSSIWNWKAFCYRYTKLITINQNQIISPQNTSHTRIQVIETPINEERFPDISVKTIQLPLCEEAKHALLSYLTQSILQKKNS